MNFANSSSCIGWLQSALWLPLGQYGSSRLAIASHSHVISLSSDFHDSKDATDIHNAIVRGDTITSLLKLIGLQVLPMLVDLCLAITYLYLLFRPYMALNIAATSVLFICTPMKLTQLARNSRRSAINDVRKCFMMCYASIDNWQSASVSISYLDFA